MTQKDKEYRLLIVGDMEKFKRDIEEAYAKNMKPVFKIITRTMNLVQITFEEEVKKEC